MFKMQAYEVVTGKIENPRKVAWVRIPVSYFPKLLYIWGLYRVGCSKQMA
jgi:hypothetical protein